MNSESQDKMNQEHSSNPNDPTLLDNVSGGSGDDASLVGKKIGNYKVEKVLGKGGMGMVYLAHDLSLDRKVVLKVLLPGLARDEEFEQRFVREARAAAKLSDSHIVQVHYAGRSQHVTFMTMEYVEGETLADYIKRRGKIPVEEALRLTLQVSRGLGSAHAKDLIHRDIKPSNVMVTPDGQVKVMDFGLAKLMQENHAVTQTGVYIGTPEYSSPEQCEGEILDARSDVYSMGVILYEMLTGRVPHVAETPLALFRKIAEEAPIPVRDLNSKVPASVANLLDRLIAKDPKDRFASADDASGSIYDLLQRLAGHEYASGTIAAVPDKARKIPFLAAVAAVFVLALFVGLAISGLLTEDGTTPEDPMAGVNPVSPEAVPEVATHERQRIVLMDFMNVSGRESDDWMTVGLPDMIGTSLAQRSLYEWVTRSEVLRTASEPTGFADSLHDGLLPVVEAMDVQVLVRGGVSVVGDNVSITIKVHSLPGDRLITTVQGHDALDHVFDLVDRLSGELHDRIWKELEPELKKARGEDDSDRKVAHLMEDSFHDLLAAWAPVPEAGDRQMMKSEAVETRLDETIRARRFDGGTGNIKVRPAAYKRSEIVERNAAPAEVAPEAVNAEAAASLTAQETVIDINELDAERIRGLLPTYYRMIAQLDEARLNPGLREQVRAEVIRALAEGREGDALQQILDAVQPTD